MPATRTETFKKSHSVYSQFDVDLATEEGDFFGFSWGNYGVIAYDRMTRDVANPATNRNYCGAEVKAKDVGNKYVLSASFHWTAFIYP